MQYIFRLQALHQPIGDELIIVRGTQMPRDVSEGHEEALEVGIVVEPFHFRQGRARHPVPLAEFQQRSRFDRSLEMQVQLGLRKQEDEARWRRRHVTILTDGWSTAKTLYRAFSRIRAKKLGTCTTARPTVPRPISCTPS